MTTDSHNWPLWWRIVILINVCVYTTMGNFYAACVSPLLVVFAKQFHVSVNDTSHLATYVVLTVGLSNVLAIPISQYIGKRYTILISMLLFMAINIWSVYCTTFHELLTARVIGGLAAGIVEALGPLIVAECFPEHQLASAMVIYSLSLGAGASIGPLVAGLVDNATGTWPWLFKISTIIVGVNMLTTILMLPETTPLKTYHKSPPASSHSQEGIDAEKSATVEEIDRSASPQETESLWSIWVKRSFFFTLPDIKPEANFLVLFLQPASLMTSPAVVLTSVVFGILIGFTVVTSIIFGSVLAQPPLLWTPLKVGLLNLSTLVGLLLGMPTGGLLADICYRRSAKRNDGTGIAESRLWALLPGAIISPVGCIIIGVALKQNLSWVALAFGWMMINFGLTAIANVMLTYCVDCYHWRSAHIGVVVNLIKNLVSFGFSYGAVPWFVAWGPLKQFGSMAGILGFFLVLSIPLSLYGRQMRNWSLKYIM